MDSLSLYLNFCEKNITEAGEKKLENIDEIVQVIFKEITTFPYELMQSTFVAKTFELMSNFETKEDNESLISLIDAKIIIWGVMNLLNDNNSKVIDESRFKCAEKYFTKIILKEDVQMKFANKINKYLYKIKEYIKFNYKVNAQNDIVVANIDTQNEGFAKEEATNDSLNNSNNELEIIKEKVVDEPVSNETILEIVNEETKIVTDESILNENELKVANKEADDMDINNSLSNKNELEASKEQIDSDSVENKDDENLNQISQENIPNERNNINEKVRLLRINNNRRSVKEWHEDVLKITSELLELQPMVSDTLKTLISFSNNITENYVLKFARMNIDLFNIIASGYEYHKSIEKNDMDDYTNAVLNYVDFMEIIVDNLAAFGIEEISSEQHASFDGRIHEVVGDNNFSPKLSLVKESKRIGFKYKDIILQKEKIVIEEKANENRN